MCGILAFKGIATPENIKLINAFLTQSQVRGKHATGVSYIYKGVIKTLVAPVPASRFLDVNAEEMEHDFTREGSISLIGHTRYCTSGFEHNQPIQDEHLSVAMNGVITQAAPEHWAVQYGLQPKTTNDTEILHYLLEEGRQPLTELGTASIAAVGLWKTGKLFAFRNTRRPAWWATTPANDGLIVASTREIFSRSGINKSQALKPGNNYLLMKNELVTTSQTELGRDLQFQSFG